MKTETMASTSKILALTLMGASALSNAAAFQSSGIIGTSRLGALQLASRTGAIRRMGLRGGGETKMGVGEDPVHARTPHHRGEEPGAVPGTLQQVEQA